MNGIILVNKEKGCTSRDVINRISKALMTRKVGHTGTLDPMATGVLVVCIGEATKLSELLTATYKEYIAEVVLGINTDTLDITGTILEENNILKSETEVKLVLREMTGIYIQEVPIYSAVKINGRKLYEYARNNEYVELPKKEVDIKELELLEIREEDNRTVFKIRCLVSKGTYIRSLIRDIASKMDTIGTMFSLVRTKQGIYNIEDTCTLEDIQKGNIKLIELSEVLKDYKVIIVDEAIENKIKDGAVLDNLYNEDFILFKNVDNKILALYQIYEKDNTKIKPFKMFKNQ